MRASCSSNSHCPSAKPSASDRSDRIVSTKSECGPLNEWMNPPSGLRVRMRTGPARVTSAASTGSRDASSRVAAA